MRENRTSGLMSGEGRRSDAEWPKPPRPSSTLHNMRLTQTLDGEGVSDSISLRGREMKSDREAPRWVRHFPSPKWCPSDGHGRVWDQGGLRVRRNPASDIMMEIVTCAMAGYL